MVFAANRPHEHRHRNCESPRKIADLESWLGLYLLDSIGFLISQKVEQCANRALKQTGAGDYSTLSYLVPSSLDGERHR